MRRANPTHLVQAQRRSEGRLLVQSLRLFSTGRYTKVQPIGAATSYPQPLENWSFSLRPLRWTPYPGLEDIAKDAGHRALAFQFVVNYILAQPDIDRSASVLKTLTFPEFMFRGPTGAYPSAVLAEVMKELSACFTGAKYTDVLITLPFCTQIETLREAHEMPILNGAWLIRGGHSMEASYIVYKPRASDIDFSFNAMPTRGLQNRDVTDIVDFKKVPMALFGMDDSQLVPALTEFDGVSVCTEICKAHLDKTAKKQGVADTDLHLIPAGGVDAVRRDHVVAREGGIVHHVDSLCVEFDRSPTSDVFIVQQDPSGVLQLVKQNERATFVIPRAQTRRLWPGDVSVKVYGSIPLTRR